MIYDLAVIGVGGVGSGALLAAARRGMKVVGIEQFGAAHNQGSSHGQTRIIREAYFENPGYVPLVRRSFEMWRGIEAEIGKNLLTVTGLMQIGSLDSEVIRGVQASSDQHSITVEHLCPAEIEGRFPWMRVPAGQVGLYEAGAGFLRAEPCVAAMIRLARNQGAEFRANSPLDKWSVADDGTIELHVGQETIRAKRAVIAGGAWSSRIAGKFLPEFKVIRKQQSWFQVDSHQVNLGGGGVAWLIDEGPESCFYGLPSIDRLGMKIGEHSCGQPVADPSDLDRNTNQADVDRAKEFINRWFRFKRVHLSFASVCMYTMSPDEHFILDRLPGMTHVSIVAGLSGHGFKFAPVLGELLVDLVDGKEDENARFLSLGRFG
jgi:sarcosine oxidase